MYHKQIVFVKNQQNNNVNILSFGCDMVILIKRTCESITKNKKKCEKTVQMKKKKKKYYENNMNVDNVDPFVK